MCGFHGCDFRSIPPTALASLKGGVYDDGSLTLDGTDRVHTALRKTPDDSDFGLPVTEWFLAGD